MHITVTFSSQMCSCGGYTALDSCRCLMWCGKTRRRWSRSPERKRSKVWRRAASPDSSSDSDGGGGGQQFLEQEGRRRAGRAGRFGTGAAADARAHHVRALHFHAVLSHRMANASCIIAPVVVVKDHQLRLQLPFIPCYECSIR